MLILLVIYTVHGRKATHIGAVKRFFSTVEKTRGKIVGLLNVYLDSTG